VADLVRFGQALLDEPRLRVVHGKPVGGVYGLGLAGERVGGAEAWGHSGSYGGFQTMLLTVPERRAVFVGLTNGSLGSKALREIEDAFLRGVVGTARRVPATVELPEPERRALSGEYANSDGRYGVRSDGDGLVVSFENGDFTARPIGERTFEITEGDRVRERFDFPLPGFGRFGSRLAERVG
jgi:beta-lactamase family protein